MKAKTKPAMPKFSFDDEAVVPTPERLRAANDNFVVDRKTGTHTMQDSPVRRMHKDGRLTDAQLDAAERYYADWYAAGMAPLGAVDYGRPMVDGHSPKTESDYRVGAAQRWRRARTDLGALGQVVDRVVLEEQSLEAAGADLGWTGASQRRAVATDRLRLGLDVLARRYGLVR